MFGNIYQQPSKVSKRLRTDGTSFSSVTPYLTSDYSGANDMNSVFGFQTDESVRATFYTKTFDQNIINENQVAFMDVDDYDRPRMLNLAQLNLWLASEAPKIFEKTSSNKHFRNKIQQGGKLLNADECEKDMIMQRIRLVGVVANHDSSHMTIANTNKRVYTCTVKGFSTIYDYWSTGSMMARQNVNCFFLLKKMKLPEDVRYQIMIHQTGKINGLMPINPIDPNKMYWQVVPYFCMDSVPPVSEYCWEGGIGGYWKVGYLKDTNIVDYRNFEGRDENTVARDISYLYEVGCSVPLQFYVKIEDSMIY